MQLTSHDDFKLTHVHELIGDAMKSGDNNVINKTWETVTDIISKSDELKFLLSTMLRRFNRMTSLTYGAADHKWTQRHWEEIQQSVDRARKSVDKLNRDLQDPV